MAKGDEPPSPPRIGPYILGRTLGVGASGRVKLAKHADTNQTVAIKIITRTINKEEAQGADAKEAQRKQDDMVRKLEREITIMKLIRHPHVMELYDVYETKKELFLVLEHVQGGELFDYLVKKGRLEESEALSFFQQIMFGLDYCHRHLVCHRDLKPGMLFVIAIYSIARKLNQSQHDQMAPTTTENLLLDGSLNIKLADFGMASLQLDGKMLETSCGSPHYASPEVILGIKYDGAISDIWSCGIILFALVTGGLPFDDENIRKLLQKVKAGVYSIPDFVKPGPRDLIKRMLVTDPSKRITVPDILQHPWFKSRPPKHEPNFYPEPLNTERLTRPIPKESIDADTLSSLALVMDHQLNAELINDLTGPSRNVYKVFYNLLLAYKSKSVQSEISRPLSMMEMDNGPRRRQGSNMSIFDPSANLGLSALGVAVNLAKSTDELKSVSPTLKVPDINAPPVPPRPLSLQSGNRKSMRHQESTVKFPSPLSTQTSTADLVAMALQETGSTKSTAGPSVRPGSQTTTVPKVHLSPLHIDTAAESPASSPAVARAMNAMSINGPTTPRFHRAVKQTEDKAGDEAPATPIINSSTPKKSWFAGILQPSDNSYIVSKTLKEMMENSTDILPKLNIKSQPSSSGKGFKCCYECIAEEKGAEPQSIFFKIHFEPQNNESECKVSIVRQQGPAHQFKALLDLLTFALSLESGGSGGKGVRISLPLQRQ